MKKALIGIFVVVVIGFIAAMFIKTDDGDSLLTEMMERGSMPSQTETKNDSAGNAMTPETSMAPATGTADLSTSNVKEFTVSGSSFKFEPAQMTVNKGDTVKITFNNTGGMHDFVIDEFNAKTERIKGGETATVTFTADKAGSFEYYCSVGNHRQMGMKGTLTVQ